MERASRREAVTVPAFAIGLALSAAVLFAIGDAVGLRSDAAEDVFIITGLLGWALVAGAALLGAGTGALLVIRASRRQPVSAAEAFLVAATFAVVAAIVATNPLWGSGSAAG